MENTSKFQKITDTLVNVGVKLSENKYLSAIKDAFVEFMPLTIIGSAAVLWSNVICNESTGLGAIWSPIMALSFLNPMFNAVNFATIGCIALITAFFVGARMSRNYDFSEVFGGGLGVVAFVTTLNTTETVGESSVSGIFSTSLGSQGLFTGMLVSIVAVELFAKLYKVEALKIKMPDQVPPQIARSFEVIIPSFICLVIIAAVSLALNLTTGLYLNDVISNLIQKPLMNVGASLPGVLLFQVVILCLWAVGLHGDNMIGAITNPIFTALTVENMENVQNGIAATNIFNSGFNRAFFATGGTGMVLGLTVAMLIKAKRDDNKAIAKLAFVPNLFNIGEVDMFGFPVVLTPALMIPFIICPLVTGAFGYFMTSIGFCPVFAYDVPWTMPPILIAFVATGGSWQAVVTQLIAIALSVLIYLPFIGIHEKSQEATNEI